jgi:protein-S-isoprenylcysteine O-methyltransferase
MPDAAVLLLLYALMGANLAIYGRRASERAAPPERPRYPISRMTRLFRRAMVAIWIAVLADIPYALYVARVGPVPLARALAALAVGIAALGLLAWSLAALGENFAACYEPRLPAAIVRHGPYRVLRHPIYLSNLLLLGAALVAVFNWPLLAATLVLALFYARSIAEEDRALAPLRAQPPG